MPKNIAEVMRTSIAAGMSTDEVLEQVYLHFPNANSGPKDVAWYRNKIRKGGGEVPNSRPRLTADERKAHKAAYEAEYKVKQQELKEERRQAAIAARRDEVTAQLEELGLTDEQVNGVLELMEL